MGSSRYEVLSTLPPGAGTRTRLAWQAGDVGFRRAVVLREVPDGAEVLVETPAPAQEGVLPLLDMVELEGRRWAVYEFVAGATFAEVAAAHFSVDRLPSLGLIARVVVDACRAIHRVHAWVDPLGLIPPQKHGGLSDASVFLAYDGAARVLDLNARRLGKFIAPELTRGDVFDARADVFSLGALLHHATTRFEKGYAVTIARAPSPAEFPPPSAVHPEATVELDAVVLRALMPSPSSRFASALQLAEEIETVLGPLMFTHEQVRTVLLPLFADRIGALKDLVDPKKRPPGPRASAPRTQAPPRASAPPVRKTGNALDALSAFDVKLDGGAALDIEDSPTQANISIPAALLRPGPPVPDFDPNATNPGKGPGTAAPALDFDPHATTPGRSLAEVAPALSMSPRASRPSGSKRNGQTAEERARARGQEKISTGEFAAVNPALQALQEEFSGAPSLGDEEEPTNVKARPSQFAMAALVAPTGEQPRAWEDPKKKEPTLDVEPGEGASQLAAVPASRRGPKAAIAVLVGAMVAGASVAVLRPDLIRGGPSETGAATVEEIPLESVVLLEDGGYGVAAAAPLIEPDADAGEAEHEGDGGEDEEEELSVLGPDSGVRDAGAGKASAKKKRKKRSR